MAIRHLICAQSLGQSVISSKCFLLAPCSKRPLPFAFFKSIMGEDSVPGTATTLVQPHKKISGTSSPGFPGAPAASEGQHCKLPGQLRCGVTPKVCLRWCDAGCTHTATLKSLFSLVHGCECQSTGIYQNV